MIRKYVFFAVCVLMMPVPAGAVEGDAVATTAFTATSVEAQGVAATSGTLAALELYYPGPSSDDEPDPVASLSLTGDKVVAQQYMSNTTLEGSVRLDPGGGGSTKPVEYWNAALSTKDVRHGATLFIKPLEGGDAVSVVVQGRLLCVEKHGLQRIAHELEAGAEADSPVGVDIGGSQRIVEPGTNYGTWDLQISGDFQIILWEWDLQVDSHGGQLIETGSKDRQAEGLPIPLMKTASQARLDVTNGNLDLSIVDALWYEGLYIHAQRVVVDGRLVLHEAVPKGDLVAEPKDKSFNGFFVASVAQDGDNFTVQFLETEATPLEGVDAVDFIPPTKLVNEESEAAPRGTLDTGSSSAAVVDDSRSLAPPLLLALAALLLVVAAGPHVVRGVRMARLRRAMDGRDYSLVAQKAPRMLRVKRYAKEAAVMVAVSRLKLGDREGAKQFLDKLPWDQKPDPATGSYLLACIRALEGDWDTAARLLAECVSANPSMGPQVVSNPWFRPLLTHPTLGEALRPTVPREGYA